MSDKNDKPSDAPKAWKELFVKAKETAPLKNYANSNRVAILSEKKQAAVEAARLGLSTASDDDAGGMCVFLCVLFDPYFR